MTSDKKPQARDRYYTKTYGISLAEYDRLVLLQGGVCAVCRRPPKPGKRLHVDHRHDRGFKKMPPEEKRLRVRGCLCYTCNRFRLGRFTSTVDIAQGVLTYLSYWPATQVLSTVGPGLPPRTSAGHLGDTE